MDVDDHRVGWYDERESWANKVVTIALINHAYFWSTTSYSTIFPGGRLSISLTGWLEQTVHMSEQPGSSKVVTTCGLMLLCRTHSAPFFPWPEHVTNSSSGSPPRLENSSYMYMYNVRCQCVYKESYHTLMGENFWNAISIPSFPPSYPLLPPIANFYILSKVQYMYTTVIVEMHLVTVYKEWTDERFSSWSSLPSEVVKKKTFFIILCLHEQLRKLCSPQGFIQKAVGGTWDYPSNIILVTLVINNS